MNKLLKQAFTLIELLVVIAIIGILSGLIIVGMNGMTQKATIAKAQVFSNSLKNALMMNLVSEWKFDELTTAVNTTPIQDSWGTNNGTLSSVGDPAVNKVSTDCVSGKCLIFDGVDDYVSCNNCTDLNSLTGLTIGVWFNQPVFNAWTNLVGKGYSSNGQWTLGIGYGGSSSPEKWGISYYDTTYHYKYIYESLGYNAWNYLVVTYDSSLSSGNWKLYRNGVYKDSDTYTGSISSSATLEIGRSTNGRYANGLIDDVRIYNAAMPTSQIKEQYYVGLNKLLANGGITREEYQGRVGELAVRL